MTGFAGVFLRDRHASVEAAAVSALCKGLSRFPGEAVASYQAPGFFLCAFDIGAIDRTRPLCIGEDYVFTAAGDPVAQQGSDPLPKREDRKDELRSALLRQDDAALARFVGSFSSVLFEPASHRLTLCVDRLGLRPLYVHTDDRQVTFATSFRVLRLALGERAQTSETGLAELALFGQGLGDGTTIKNAIVLEPAEKMRASASRTDRTRYFRWDEIEPETLSADESCKRLLSVFERAVARRRQNAPEEWAFLSGGMDSRCVVGALKKAGAQLATFSTSIGGTADAVLAPIVAQAIGTRHFSVFRKPEARVTIDMDSFALYARRNFEPASKLPPETGFAMWSGDGGSVGMGHVYVTESMVEAARRGDIGALVESINPGLDGFMRRTLRAGMVDRFRKHARAALEHELTRYSPREKGRLPFLYFLLNDQRRHLYGHYEDIDRSRIEFLTPFFDMEFPAQVMALPIDHFLRHKLYNRWMTHFPAFVHGVPWQAYPGHEPCPHPLPPGVMLQWDKGLFHSAEVDRAHSFIVRQIKCKAPQPVWTYLSRTTLTGLDWAARLGIRRYSYEVEFARKIAEAVGTDLALDRAA